LAHSDEQATLRKFVAFQAKGNAMTVGDGSDRLTR